MAVRRPAYSGMRGIASVPSYVVMQPTTLCNLDCVYCYLPARAVDRRMPVAVAEAVAAPANEWARQGRFSVVWHGGEPLAAGRDHLAALMAPFRGVEHHIQTNATLIDDAWCDFFLEHDVHIGLSLDGPRSATAGRRLRSGGEAYDRIVAGIETLRRRGIPFAILVVVSDPRPGLAEPLYRFLADLGPTVIAVNLEEQEGVNRRPNAYAHDRVRAFWSELTAAWRRDPRVEVREVEWALRFAGAALAGDATFGDLGAITLAVDGDLVTAATATLDAATTERTLLLAEIYRRDDVWRLRVIGQGYDDGLAGLAVRYGVDVAEA